MKVTLYSDAPGNYTAIDFNGWSWNFTPEPFGQPSPGWVRYKIVVDLPVPEPETRMGVAEEVHRSEPNT